MYTSRIAWIPAQGKSDMARVNVGKYISHSLELVQKLYYLVHLVEDVYLTPFVLP
jgi:hypothetical protein